MIHLQGDVELARVGGDSAWAELFLLKVNGPFLAQNILRLETEELVARKSILNAIFSRSIAALHVDNSLPCRLHGLQTLAVLLRSLFMKKLSNFSYDIMNLLTGLSGADSAFKRLAETLEECLVDRDGLYTSIVSAALDLIGVIVTATDNINQNSLNQYFIIHNEFVALAKIISEPGMQANSYIAGALIGLLCNYNKYERRNPYVAQLAEMQDELFNHRLSLYVKRVCDGCVRSYTLRETPSVGVTFILAGCTDGDSCTTKCTIHTVRHLCTIMNGNYMKISPTPDISILLVFYECTQNNPYFLRSLASAWDAHTLQSSSPRSPKSPSSTELASRVVADFEDNSNVFVSIISLASYLFQHNRDVRTVAYSKMCIILLLVAAENESAAAFFCSSAKKFHVQMCRERHPQLPDLSALARPLACHIFDVICIFITHNMRRNLQSDLYLLSLEIIQRLILCLKHRRVRLQYHWPVLYTCLINLLKYLLAHSSILESRPHAGAILESVIVIFNLIITHGDTFLPDTASYDFCYYEIIRNSEVFVKLQTYYDGIKGSVSPQSPSVHSPSTLASTGSDLSNIAAICSHFLPKLKPTSNGMPTITTPEGVLLVLRQHYDSLELKLSPRLGENVVEFRENPKHCAFFRQLARIVSSDLRAYLLGEGSVGADSPFSSQRRLSDSSSASSSVVELASPATGA